MARNGRRSESARGRRGVRRALSHYLEQSRSGANSLLLTVPLLLAYQAGLIWTGGDVRNGADALLSDLLGRFGRPAVLIVNLLVCLVFILVAARRGRPPASPVGLLLPVLAESGLYACALAPAVAAVVGVGLNIARAPVDERWTLTVLSVGAGFYEELLFRLLGVAGAFWLMRRIVRLSAAWSLGIAVFGAALAFSTFHHVGLGAEPYRTPVFLFRFAAGVVLGVLFILRGFGVACYTHAIYNLLVVWR